MLTHNGVCIHALSHTHTYAVALTRGHSACAVDSPGNDVIAIVEESKCLLIPPFNGWLNWLIMIALASPALQTDQTL